jgi:hypothetical protein
LRNLYLYLVCLITLIIVIFSVVQLVRGVVELLYPDPGYYQTYPERDPELTEEEAAAQEQAQMDSQRRYAVLGIVSSATALLIAGPLYVYHWRKIEKELPASADAPSAPPGPPPAT